MSYQERVQLALDQIEEDPMSCFRGNWFLEHEFRVECIDIDEDTVFFVCIDTITKGVHFHYKDCTDPSWSYTASLLSEIGAKLQPVYRNWLDSHGYSLAPKPMEIEEKPWLIEQIIGWKNEE